MNCASFENRLTELLDGHIGETAREAALAELQRHVEECPECAGAGVLVEWAALPADQRDPVEVPPESYWEGFSASVARRLDRTETSRPGAAWRRYAAVASIAVALFAGWSLRGWLDPGTGSEQSQVAAGDASEDPEWSRLDEVIRQASPEELAEVLRGLPGEWAGIEASGWGGDWIPADELDENDRLELMDWLDQLEQSERRPTS